ncbi:ABC transporter ATP-binding protein [Pseudalkalibacillus decolorationis]|uniref:ABC transporter ATP-binding protein n=1 Tax=Pseudalkalibacillus decolorationis TaxID=163879 RepID=UPI0021499313|nr:ABC transporter ATP-binding protein [Pseudalkalibacillus decolorationis]
MISNYIELNNLTKYYNKQPIFNIPHISIEKGEIVSIVGPSGTGKSTLLRIIAGLVEPDSGEIFIDGYSMDRISPQKRPAVYMFQESLLFPHMNVIENIAFGLKMANVKKKDRSKWSENMLRKVGLEGFQTRFPHEISGGQKQRVALAMSLIVKPKVLLLDEPFSNLDSELRKETRRWIKQLLKDEGMTVLFVTHDLEEAMAIGDRVAILADGLFQQFAHPKELYESPANHFVSTFLQAGIWSNDRFISVNRLAISAERPIGLEGTWEAEVIENYYQDGKYHLVVRLSESEDLLTIEIDKEVDLGKSIFLYIK